MEPAREEGRVRVTGRVAKPTGSQALRHYAAIGRQVLDQAVFPALERTPPGRGGDIRPTDALPETATAHGALLNGGRRDTGAEAGHPHGS
ncbi:hypothetical protein [Streptomyces sp. NPDC029041]|uniref:hypothetical protein n=1 Tax=Streptomyces sp. NPDC029041 TaxID=3155727 RepID=UPI0033D0ED23